MMPHFHQDLQNSDTTGKNHEHDSGASEVIGTILLVAFTVILAAIIASLAFGLVGSTLQKTKAVAVSVTQVPDNNIRCVYLGGTNDPELEYLEIIDPLGTRWWTTSANGVIQPFGTGTYKRPVVGSTMILSGVGTPGNKDHVVVVGHFSDGAIQVLIDSWV